MKILMIFRTYRGGVAIHAKEVSGELKNRNIQVTLLSRNEDLKLTNFVKSHSKLKKLFRKWSNEYDIVHVHDWALAYSAINSGIKNLIATFHGFPTNSLAKYFQNYCIKKLGNRVVVVSPKMKKKYKNATYIANGVNLKLFRKIKNREHDKIGAAQILSSNIEEIKMAVAPSHLKIARKLPYEKMPQFYSSLKIFISIPLKSTGFNMAWAEAMACEVPFIIGTNEGIGENLPIYKISSLKELQKIVDKINKGQIKKLIGQRKWLIKNKLTWKNHANNLLKLYRKVLK